MLQAMVGAQRGVPRSPLGVARLSRRSWRSPSASAGVVLVPRRRPLVVFMRENSNRDGRSVPAGLATARSSRSRCRLRAATRARDAVSLLQFLTCTTPPASTPGADARHAALVRRGSCRRGCDAARGRRVQRVGRSIPAISDSGAFSRRVIYTSAASLHRPGNRQARVRTTRCSPARRSSRTRATRRSARACGGRGSMLAMPATHRLRAGSHLRTAFATHALTRVISSSISPASTVRLMQRIRWPARCPSISTTTTGSTTSRTSFRGACS